MKRYLKSSEGIFGMARVCWVPTTSKNSIEVYINTDDGGNIPHFHVRKYSKEHKHEWEVCVKFEAPEYFSHGRYSGSLPSGIEKILDKALRTTNPKSRHGDTYWETAVDAWNNNNSTDQLDFDIEQPDYTKL